MVERGERDHFELLPETRQLIVQTEQLTGLPVELRPDPDVARHGRALYAISAGISERHLILYVPKYEEFASHLVAHELGHVRHFHEAATEERAVPVLTLDSRAAAIDQLAPEISALARKGVPRGALADLIPLWIAGTVTQLANTPSDRRIERWLYFDHPALREAQRRSLASQVRDLHKVLSPMVEAFTPPTVWIASTAINYALVKDISNYFAEPWMLRPYRGSVGEAVGENLISIAEAVPGEDSLDKDHRVADAWAARLGVGDWYRWQSLG